MTTLALPDIIGLLVSTPPILCGPGPLTSPLAILAGGTSTVDKDIPFAFKFQAGGMWGNNTVITPDFTGNSGYYRSIMWSSSTKAWNMWIGSDDYYMSNSYSGRSWGMSIRPVTNPRPW